MPKGCYKRGKTLIQRFMAKVGPPTATGCREWTGAIDSNGSYGIFRFEGKNYGPHVISATAFYGVIPDGKIVCHHCDNSRCVNPQHLYIGTQTQNVHDAIRRGRFMGAAAIRLFPEEVVEIKASPLSSRKLARVYGISSTMICQIRLGRWPKVKVAQ